MSVLLRLYSPELQLGLRWNREIGESADDGWMAKGGEIE